MEQLFLRLFPNSDTRLRETFHLNASRTDVGINEFCNRFMRLYNKYIPHDFDYSCSIFSFKNSLRRLLMIPQVPGSSQYTAIWAQNIYNFCANCSVFKIDETVLLYIRFVNVLMSMFTVVLSSFVCMHECAYICFCMYLYVVYAHNGLRFVIIL